MKSAWQYIQHGSIQRGSTVWQYTQRGSIFSVGRGVLGVCLGMGNEQLLCPNNTILPAKYLIQEGSISERRVEK